MSAKSVILMTKKSKEVTFKKTKKNFKLIILMLLKYLFLKKNRMVHIIHLNTLMDTTIMMLLDRCL